MALRLVAGSEIGRNQIVFSYPAVVVATLLYGFTAGATTAAACLLIAWYYVIPPTHSFAIRDVAAVTTVVVDVLVSTVLVLSIGALRIAIARLRELTLTLEQRVEQSTAERNRLWERSPELIVIGAQDGTVQSINPAFSRLLAGAGVGDRNLFDMMSGKDAARLRDAIRRLSSGSRAESLETDLSTSTGQYVVAWSAVLDGASLFLIGRDVTAERECNEQLRQSHKVEAVGQMTGGLAHDLANYLSPIVMSLDLIRRRHPEDAQTAILIQGAADSADRAGALVRRLLRFARRERSEPALLDLRAQLDALVPLLQQTVLSRPLATRFADDLPAVFADANELDSALLNLAANARDATGPQDRLTLSASPCDEARIVIEFCDTGKGMDAETLARAQEPFFSTKPRGEGTGLGLAMVRDFAQRSGGELRIESEAGVGTRVAIILPIAHAAQATPPLPS